MCALLTNYLVKSTVNTVNKVTFFKEKVVHTCNPVIVKKIAFSTKMTKPSVYITREINKEALDILKQQ